MPEDLPKFYKDFDSPDMESAIAMIHSRFSTNTFPSWERARNYTFYICFLLLKLILIKSKLLKIQTDI